MRDLCCARCARVVIADFWTMVRDEPVPTFSRIRLTCTCGARVRVDLSQRWRYFDDSGELLLETTR